VLKIFGVIASGVVLVWENKKDLNTEGDCRVEFSGDDGGRQLIAEFRKLIEGNRTRVGVTVNFLGQ
jgi:hypothetical protein